MAGILESQLSAWAKQGAVTTAASTYNSVNKALLDVNTSVVRHKDIDVYLQGSYRNDTNIRGDSDTDVVVELNSTWSRNLSRLSAYEAELYKETHSPATYLWEDFRSDVLKALRSYFGNDMVSEGNKYLKIAGDSGRLPADVACARSTGSTGASTAFTISISSRASSSGLVRTDERSSTFRRSTTRME